MADGDRVVKREDWKSLHMPEQCTKIELNIQYSAEDMATLKRGVCPEEMEDKWFIYFEEDESKLYLHRSWTGYCVFVVEFNVEESGEATAKMVVVNREHEQYRSTDDESDRETLTDILKYIVGVYPKVN